MFALCPSFYFFQSIFYFKLLKISIILNKAFFNLSNTYFISNIANDVKRTKIKKNFLFEFIF